MKEEYLNSENKNPTASEGLPPLTQEQQNKIKTLEDAPIDVTGKFDLFLIILGKRLATYNMGTGLHFKQTKEKAEDFLRTSKNENQLSLDLCHKLGLETELEKVFVPRADNANYYVSGWLINVAPSKDLLDKLKELRFKPTIGLLFGYPETAVNAYTNKKHVLKLTEEMSREIKKEDPGKFLNFYLSQDNWKSELETIKKTRDLFKKYSPKIYNEILEAEKTGDMGIYSQDT
ncbi:MAG: hypothetical protein V4439_01230 [Patescibacteria group bacterium]